MSNAIADLHFHMDCSLNPSSKGVRQYERSSGERKSLPARVRCPLPYGSCLAEPVMAKGVRTFRAYFSSAAWEHLRDNGRFRL